MGVEEQKIPLWLDCDPGHDDACAILLAAYHPSLHLLGISTVYGNAPLTKTTNNALAVLQAIGRPDISVFPGVDHPFCRTIKTAPEIHGESGLDGTNLLPQPKRKPLSHCNAITHIKDALFSCPPNSAWLVATGSLTNIALLFSVYPEVASHIRGLSIMGGAIGNEFCQVSMGPSYVDSHGKTCSRIGNMTPFAEFNILCDPEAAQCVFGNPILRPKTILIPLDVTHQAYAGKDIQNFLLHGENHDRAPTKLRRMFNELLMFFSHTYADVFGLTEGPPLHDPLAVAALLFDHPDAATRISLHDNNGERWSIQVVLEGEETGRTVATPAKDGTIVPRRLDLKKFWSALEYCMAQADDATGHQR